MRKIPLYSADGELREWVTEQRLAKYQAQGRIARVIRHRKGYINRAILFGRPGEKLFQPGDYVGTRYSYPEYLENGYIAWALRRLGRGDEFRPLFLRVVSDCLVASTGRCGSSAPLRGMS
jgi:hypothetical protein